LNPKIDVAIVGAGPAGARAAYVLARGGARVTIFDPSHPREKPCGGGVTGRALALVADAVDPDSWPSTVIGCARFVNSARGLSAVVPLEDRGARPESALTVTSRAAFDAALLEAAVRAGAVVERTRVRDVAVEPGGVRLETETGSRHAAVVFGGDGANSLVRRRLSRAFRRDQLSIATGFFAHGVTSQEIVIELVSNPPGYIWSFPRPDHLAIGICGQADAGITAGTLRAMTGDWIAATGIAAGARLEPYAWPIPSLGARDLERLDVAGPRWLLLGDAAGLVDPITREGIYFALASGQWAADAWLSGGGPDAYTARVRDEAAPELARAARLKAGFFRPAFTGLMMHALQQSPGIRRVMADLVAGRQSYAGLKTRLLGTFEWRLALRALRVSWP
jgi:geranylgeranyl reductase family protein